MSDASEIAVAATPRRPAFLDVLFCFAVGGFVLHMIISAILLVCTMASMSFITGGINIDRAVSGPSFLFPLMFGLYVGFAISELSVLASVVIAATVFLIWRRIPAWALIVMFPVCFVALYWQAITVMVPAEQIQYDPARLGGLGLHQLLVLAGCFWCHQRRARAVSSF